MRGQGASEFLLLLGFILLLILPVGYWMFTSTQESSRIVEAQLAVTTLKQTVDYVYYQSPGARQLVTVFLPGGVEWTQSYVGHPTDIEGKEISLAVYTSTGGTTDVFEATKGDVRGSWPGSSGNYRYLVKKMSEGYVLVVPFDLTFLLTPETHTATLEQTQSTWFPLTATEVDGEARTLALTPQGDIADWISFDGGKDELVLPANGDDSTGVTVTVPLGTAFGIYSGAVQASDGNTTSATYITIFVTGAAEPLPGFSGGLDVNIIAPANTTYSSLPVNLTFTVNESFDWCGYTLDGETIVSVDTNTSILPTNGTHYLLLRCIGAGGRTGSDDVYFTTNFGPEPWCWNLTMLWAYDSDYNDEMARVLYSNDVYPNGTAIRADEPKVKEYVLAFIQTSFAFALPDDPEDIVIHNMTQWVEHQEDSQGQMDLILQWQLSNGWGATVCDIPSSGSDIVYSCTLAGAAGPDTLGEMEKLSTNIYYLSQATSPHTAYVDWTAFMVCYGEAITVLNIDSPLNQTYTTRSVWLNVSSNALLDTALYSLDSGANQSMTESGQTAYALNSSMTPGSHTVVFWANDSNGHAISNSTAFTVVEVTTLALDRHVAYQYENLTAVGTGYTANGSVKIYINDSLNWGRPGYPVAVQANSTGGITYTFNVSSACQGTFTVAAVDQTNTSKTASDTYSVWYFSDDFGNGTLSPKWHWFNEPATWSEGTPTAGWLRMVSDQYTHFWMATHSGNFLYQNLTGDFKVEMKANHTPMTNYENVGMMVMGDEHNWVKFDHAYSSAVPGYRYFSATSTVNDVSSVVMSPVAYNGSIIYYRAQRIGNTFLFNVSGDGVSWTDRGPYTISLPGTVMAGLYVADGEGGTNHVAELDYIRRIVINETGSCTGYAPDTTPPNVTMASPLNQTYNVTQVWVNATVSENASWCGYSMDGNANVTMGSSSATAWYYNASGLSNTSHYVNIWCNDTSGNMASSGTRYFTVAVYLLPYYNKTVYPYFSSSGACAGTQRTDDIALNSCRRAGYIESGGTKYWGDDDHWVGNAGGIPAITRRGAGYFNTSAVPSNAQIEAGSYIRWYIQQVSGFDNGADSVTFEIATGAADASWDANGPEYAQVNGWTADLTLGTSSNGNAGQWVTFTPSQAQRDAIEAHLASGGFSYRMRCTTCAIGEMISYDTGFFTSTVYPEFFVNYTLP